MNVNSIEQTTLKVSHSVWGAFKMMKNIFLIALLSFLFFSCNSNAQDQNNDMASIDVNEITLESNSISESEPNEYLFKERYLTKAKKITRNYYTLIKITTAAVYKDNLYWTALCKKDKKYIKLYFKSNREFTKVKYINLNIEEQRKFTKEIKNNGGGPNGIIKSIHSIFN